MRRLRILTWHIHGSYLYYLVQGPHDFLVPVKPVRYTSLGLAVCEAMMLGLPIIGLATTETAWPSASAYHASKWGLFGLSNALHVEARPHRVKVTAVISAGMRTPFILDRFPDVPLDVLQDPQNVAETVRFVLTQPEETVIPEVMVLPMRETS
jgi:NAD(P)-dependent dehydrogenase (short-subunit alcohol dehydrogenase family)